MPLIHPAVYDPRGDYNALNAIFGNAVNQDSKTHASQRRYVAKSLPGVETPGSSWRATLQDHIGDFLGLDTDETSMIYVTSGTDALEAVLRAVRATQGADKGNEVHCSSDHDWCHF